MYTQFRDLFRSASIVLNGEFYLRHSLLNVCRYKYDNSKVIISILLY